MSMQMRRIFILPARQVARGDPIDPLWNFKSDQVASRLPWRPQCFTMIDTALQSASWLRASFMWSQVTGGSRERLISIAVLRQSGMTAFLCSVQHLTPSAEDRFLALTAPSWTRPGRAEKGGRPKSSSDVPHDDPAGYARSRSGSHRHGWPKGRVRPRPLEHRPGTSPIASVRGSPRVHQMVRSVPSMGRPNTLRVPPALPGWQ